MTAKCFLQTIVLFSLCFSYGYSMEVYSLTKEDMKISYEDNGDIYAYDFPYKAQTSDLKTTSPHLGMWITSQYAKKLPEGIQSRFYHVTVTARYKTYIDDSRFKDSKAGTPDEELAKGLAAHNAGSFDTAAKIFADFFSKYPEHPNAPYAMFMTGQVLCQLHKFKEANAVHGLLVNRYKDSPLAGEALLRIACVYAGHLNDENKAKQLFMGLINISNNQEVAADALFYLGALGFIRGNLQEATQFFKKIVDEYPQSTRSPSAKKSILYIQKDN